MWHRRWIGLAVAWIAAIIGVAVVYRMPERYEASARVYVDTQSLLRPLMAGIAIQPNLDQQVALMSRTLISRPNVEKLVRMADLDLRLAHASRSATTLIDIRHEPITAVRQAERQSLHRSPIATRIPSRRARSCSRWSTIFVESSLGDKTRGHAATRSSSSTSRSSATSRAPARGGRSAEGVPPEVPGRRRHGKGRTTSGASRSYRLPSRNRALEVHVGGAVARRPTRRSSRANAERLPDLLEGRTATRTTESVPEIDTRIDKLQIAPRRASTQVHGSAS